MKALEWKRILALVALCLAWSMLVGAEGSGCNLRPVEPRPCPEIYSPVCGDDDVTYDNECLATRAGAEVAHEGECTDDECVCIAVWDPVCGDDGLTYDNPCAADCAGVEIAYRGECTDECVCPDVYAPVCGDDGVTYGNRCEARCAGAEIAHEGACEIDPCV